MIFVVDVLITLSETFYAKVNTESEHSTEALQKLALNFTENSI